MATFSFFLKIANIQKLQTRRQILEAKIIEINFETESLTFENSNKQGELFRAKMYGNGNGNT